MHEPPEFVLREAAGLERFADSLWDERLGPRARLMNLPFEQTGYWFAQAAAVQHMFAVNQFAPGSKILDVGSNTCWASNMLAERGLDVIALDIAPTLLQGLRTADWWFEENGVYFERMLSVMFDPAIASDSLDYVFCSEVLHHNHHENLLRTFAELYRVLKPGGKLLMTNEPLKFPTNLKRDHAQEVAEYEGHEHVYFAHQYLLGARRAGFRVKIMRPNTTPFFRNEPLVLEPTAGYRETLSRAGQQLLRTTKGGRQFYTAYKLLLGPDISLSMIGEKPPR